MKFITVRDFRNKPAQIWKELKKDEEMVVTSNGKPVALLTSLSEDTLESTLALVKKIKAISAVNSMQITSMKLGTNLLSLKEINKEISAIREKRR